MTDPMTNEQIEVVARAIGEARCDAGRPDPGKGLDEFIATAAIAAMPDRFLEGYAAAKAQAVLVVDKAGLDGRANIIDAELRTIARIIKAIASMEPGA